GHSNHFVPPFNETAAVSGVWDTLFGRIDEWDKVITATSRQQQHMADSFGHIDTFDAIAHGVGMIPETDYSVLPEPNPNRFIVVSRIQVKKDVAESIRVLRHIVDHNPNAYLDFYGFGYSDQLEKELHILIKELSLTKHVHFKGFITNIQDAYRGAVATIFTSRSEGFGMAILESMGYGVPVISYDICYGPSEIIENGKTGYIIPPGDTKAFATAAIQLMNYPDLRRRMGELALQSVPRFSDEVFTEKWITLLHELD
ncbi:glycosyltransferase, partial [Exiguobacterium sp.]|uniref:glycosyltransferase n=1 Tax=Exiguobacterium sp. TaxID=44751 RepID=UPI00289EC77F